MTPTKTAGCAIRGEEEDGVGRAQVKGVGGPAIVDTVLSVTMCRAWGGEMMTHGPRTIKGCALSMADV